MALHRTPFDPRRPGLVRPVPVDPAGVTGPTRGQARGPGYRCTSHGLFVPHDVDDDLVEQRIIEGLPRSPEALITGWAGLRWMGGRWFQGVSAGGHRLPVPVTGAKTVRRRAGVLVSKESWLDPTHVLEVDGLPVTSAVRSVLFEMRYAPTLAAAVIALDMAAYDDLVSVEEAAEFTRTMGPRTGVGQARRAVSLASENSWSPMETWMRLVWTIDAHLPTPLCNQPVFDRSGRHVGTPDLLDAEAGVVGEYDGALHLEPHRRRADRDREESFRAVGLEYFTVLAGDGRSEASVARMRGARERARWETESSRLWTLESPPGWTDTTTVAHRRALSAAERSRLLAYRRAG